MDKKQELKSQRPLNRDAIKYIAIVAMTFNHAAKAFMEQGTVPYEVCTYIGYIAAPLMCFSWWKATTTHIQSCNMR